jgi:hypothetical protein
MMLKQASTSKNEGRKNSLKRACLGPLPETFSEPFIRQRTDDFNGSKKQPKPLRVRLRTVEKGTSLWATA